MTEHSAPSFMREESWHKAQHRVSVYLRLLKVPTLESLSIALEAMKRALSHDDTERHPIQKSMEAVREVLLERTEKQEKGLVRRTRSTPPLNRGFMVPEEII